MKTLCKYVMLVLVLVLVIGCGGPTGEGSRETRRQEQAFSFKLPPALDPGRNSTVVTGWQWWLNRTESQLDTIRQSGHRIIDLERTSNNRFNAVFVANTGLYVRSGADWYSGYSAWGVTAKAKALNGRVLDLEPYDTPFGRRFTFNMIKNRGWAKKAWKWNYDRTPQQIASEIKAHGLRLTDIEAYRVNGVTRYAYVGIKNAGVDAKAWWWYVNVTPAYLDGRLKAHGARLIDQEVQPNGRVTAIMVKNHGTAWWYGRGLTRERVDELVATTASRIIDLESYLVSGKRRYAVVTIDNANEETRRLRGLIYQAFDKPDFGDKIIRGFLVKEVNGPVIADMAGGLRFQPLSVLKLLPYLYTLIQIDKNNDYLTNYIWWLQAKTDDPATDWDETLDATCLAVGPTTSVGLASLADALPTMMWFSHNRTLDAVMNKYSPDQAITPYVQTTLQMTNTEMYPGCTGSSSTTKLWPSNRTTLHDLARMFEGIDNLTTLTKVSSRDLFYDNMIHMPYKTVSYTSPYRGTTAAANNSYLRTIVQREAGSSRQHLVEPFLQHVLVHVKGGSGGPSNDEVGYTDFKHIRLPFKSRGGRVYLKNYVGGWFTYKLKTPPGCPDTEADDGGTCQAIWQSEIDARAALNLELFTVPIRQALATW